MEGGGGGATRPSLNSRELGRNQARQNVQSAIAERTMNNTNQVTPWGSLTYDQTGGYTDENDQFVPQYTATTSLSPDRQNLFNLAVGSFPQVQGAYSRFMNQGPLPDTRGYTDQAYQALTARGNQDIATQRLATEAQLANQGVATGSDAYNRAFQPINRQAVDLSTQATGAAQSLADQYLNRDIAVRQQDLAPMQAYSSLIGLATGMPQFMQTPQNQVQAADVTSPAMAAYKAQSDAYNAQQAQARSSSNGLMGGLFGLGGSILGGVLGGPAGSLGSMLGSSLFGLGGASSNPNLSGFSNGGGPMGPSGRY